VPGNGISCRREKRGEREKGEKGGDSIGLLFSACPCSTTSPLKEGRKERRGGKRETGEWARPAFWDLFFARRKILTPPTSSRQEGERVRKKREERRKGRWSRRDADVSECREKKKKKDIKNGRFLMACRHTKEKRLPPIALAEGSLITGKGGGKGEPSRGGGEKEKREMEEEKKNVTIATVPQRKGCLSTITARFKERGEEKKGEKRGRRSTTGMKMGEGLTTISISKKRKGRKKESLPRFSSCEGGEGRGKNRKGGEVVKVGGCSWC